MPVTINQKIALAHEFVLHTSRNVFLTGKAGTGKTTFLHQIKQLSAKRLAVVAPTGVAAINAGGVTIHSLFQLPFGPLVPGTVQREGRPFNREKINLLRTLDLLVIDEISMVRADVLDGIDVVLRRYRANAQPFGGVQLLLIGDMQQLPPVIRDDDWTLLRPHYETGYFFGSKALRQTPYVSIELTHIYRQSDERFIELLNSIREKTITREQLADLNQRHVQDFNPADDEGYITLSTHNHTAQQINSQKLKDLKGKLRTFSASIDKEFPTQAYPTDAELDLKVGAQVMFIKNDASPDKLFYNGKIGRVTGLDDDVVHVKSGYETIAVDRLTWENIRYTLDSATGEIKSEVIGQFTQFPLKLAWAITIHKSQGLTFERAIIDASAAFAHGQVYVALSRCKTLDGLVLRTPIPSHSIKTEQTLEDFHEQVQQQTPTEGHLHDAKRHNQQQLLEELFSFESAHSLLQRGRRVVGENGGSLPDELPSMLEQLANALREKARDVARRFVGQLPTYFAGDGLPEANEPLQERIRKAGAYFQVLLTDELLPLLHQCPTDCDNKQVRESLLEALDELERTLFSKRQSFAAVRSGFDALAYLQARNRAELDFVPKRKENDRRTANAARDDADHDGSAKGGLYGALTKWRNDLAGEHNTSGYLILPQKTIVELCRARPTTMNELLTIKGFGRTKAKQIGDEVLRIIQNYTGRVSKPVRPGPSVDEAPGPKTKKPKLAKASQALSPSITLALFRSGKSLADIAAERSLAVSTIESHLAQCISAGDLAVEEVLPMEKIAAIRSFLQANQPGSMNEVMRALDNQVTYAEIRFVSNAMKVETE